MLKESFGDRTPNDSVDKSLWFGTTWDDSPLSAFMLSHLRSTQRARGHAVETVRVCVANAIAGTKRRPAKPQANNAKNFICLGRMSQVLVK